LLTSTTLAASLAGLSYLLAIAGMVGLVAGGGRLASRLRSTVGKTAVWVAAAAVAAALLAFQIGVVPSLMPATKFLGAESSGDDLLLVFETGGRSHSPQVRTFDLRTGAVIAVQRPMSLDYLGYRLLGKARVDGRVWLHSEELGVHQRQMHSGQVVLRESELVAANPLLSGGVAPGGYRLDAETGDLCLETRDHYVVRLDAEHLHGVRLAPAARDQDCRPRSRRRCTDSSIDLGNRSSLEFVGSPRSQVARSRPHDGPLVLDEAHSYLSPVWVLEDYRRPVRFGIGPAADVLLAHRAPDDHHTTLARLALDTAEPRWGAPIGAADAEIQWVRLDSERLVVITLGEIVALDPGDGHRLWSANF
jgi:hypothetical protein